MSKEQYRYRGRKRYQNVTNEWNAVGETGRVKPIYTDWGINEPGKEGMSKEKVKIYRWYRDRKINHNIPTKVHLLGLVGETRRTYGEARWKRRKLIEDIEGGQRAKDVYEKKMLLLSWMKMVTLESQTTINSPRQWRRKRWQCVEN